MTVKELIEELKKFPEDTIVCGNDYEYGRYFPHPKLIELEYTDRDIQVPKYTKVVEFIHN